MTSQLTTSILRWCEQYHWYGAELDFRRFAAPADDPRHSHFLTSPATTQQVTLAEEMLGFPLPPALTLLYQTLANGGFGPAYGLRSLDPADNESLVSQYQSRRYAEKRMLSEVGGQRLWVTPPQQIDLHYQCWPNRLVPICNWGCGVEICLECSTPEGRVIRVGPARQDIHLTLTGIAASLETWLKAWLAEPVL